ncbi:AbrB family transcriptional regulator [Cohnella pontilimi]|uniref:AbrB family transcriptional regulator n=1 Tax=Cohnella pontilimi TaxID=2564100 RepID=A0A4U0F7H9_9BACL|nr:AbrB family transcriptional regulator [Cohnella pontilimi]TJY40667.1 AbrB family transcriptional regulator [Cohnella pontilimi]
MTEVMKMERKVAKFGNSLGITMTEALKQIGLDSGDTVVVDVRSNSDEIVIRKANKVTLPPGISADFLKTLSDVMVQYDETLKGLKDR